MRCQANTDDYISCTAGFYVIFFAVEHVIPLGIPFDPRNLVFFFEERIPVFLGPDMGKDFAPLKEVGVQSGFGPYHHLSSSCLYPSSVHLSLASSDPLEHHHTPVDIPRKGFSPHC